MFLIDNHYTSRIQCEVLTALPFCFSWIKKFLGQQIENLRWQLGGEIIQVTFRKSSTSLVQQLKKNLNKLYCATGCWLPHSLFKFFLKLLDQWCWRFFEGYLNNFSTQLSSQIFDCCPRNSLIQEERIGNVVSTSHWIWPVHYEIMKLFTDLSQNWVLFLQGDWGGGGWAKRMYLHNVISAVQKVSFKQIFHFFKKFFQ